ncbi:MAG: RNA pseudouridine synthase [Rhodoferax sp.]
MTDTPTPDAGGERLAKRVAALLACSRSQAEHYIEGGWVRVDGQVVQEPQFRVTLQQVALDPQASLQPLAPVTLVLHKPPDWPDGCGPAAAPVGQAPDVHTLLQAAYHTAHDRSGVRVLQRHFRQLDAAVPLETGASGLLVFSQDWRVLRKLRDDLALMEHELIAEVQGSVSEAAMQSLRLARDTRGQALPAAKVSLNSSTPGLSKLRFAIKGAHPGLVAYLCERAHLQLLALRRIRLGRVALRDLPQGQWRYLGAGERF